MLYGRLAQILRARRPALAISASARDTKRVAGDDLEPSRPMRADIGERGKRARVALDRDHLPRALREEARA